MVTSFPPKVSYKAPPDPAFFSGARFLDGWSSPEPGHRWMIGEHSALTLPYEPGAGTLVVRIQLFPVALPERPVQRIFINAAGREFFENITTRCWLDLAFPGLGEKGGDIKIEFSTPDSAAPADFNRSSDRRKMACAIEFLQCLRVRNMASGESPPLYRPALPFGGSATPPALIAAVTALGIGPLLRRFESLGRDCEFGILQRQLGEDPLALLRFASILPGELLEGLTTGFAGVADPEQLRLETEINVDRPQYLVQCTRYGMEFHSFIDTESVPQSAAHMQMQRYLTRMREMFLETLTQGQKIFVLHHEAIASPTQARPFLHALQRHGENALLFATHGTGEPGSLIRHQSNLYQGHIAHRMRGPELALDTLGWLSVCANAYRTWREAGFCPDF